MATGIVLALGASSSGTYTPKVNAKCKLTALNATINGVAGTSASAPVVMDFYVGASQQVSIVVSGSGGFALLTTLEQS